MMKPDALWASDALKSSFTRPYMMAFFPGTVLSQLHGLLGDVREAMSLLAGLTQTFVTIAVLAGLMILSRSFARGLALLRALGAPSRYIFCRRLGLLCCFDRHGCAWRNYDGHWRRRIALGNYHGAHRYFDLDQPILSRNPHVCRF
jgi:hypothetical protein